MTTNRRLSIRVSTLTAMTITASLLNPAFTPLATADVHSTFGLAPRDGVAQTVADNTPALAWGIRGSFYRYVAGATHILDGAKKGPGDYFLWPYQSTKAEGDRLIIQYGGTVNFMKYCGANNELVRGRCDLDFTFADPKIDIDTTTGLGHIYATVHTKSYQKGTWSGPTEVQVGTIDTNAGRYNTDNGVTTWSGVSTKLTADGNNAFSNFYEPESFLDSLNFSYPTAGDIKETQQGYNLRNQIATDTEYNGGGYLFPRTDGNLVLVTGQWGGKGTVRVFDKNLSKLNPGTEIPLTRHGSSGYDTLTNTLYWLNEQDVYAATVTATGIDAPTKIASVPGQNVLGFAYSDSTKELGVISLTPGTPAPSFTTIPVSGTTAGNITTVPLPAPRDLYPNLQEERDDDMYGAEFGGDVQGLRALPDGSFITVHGHLLDMKDGGKRQRNLPIHITPKAETKARIITELASDYRDDLRGITMNKSGRMVMWSNLGTSPLMTVQYNAETQRFTTLFTSDGLPQTPSIAGATFSEDGTLVIASESKSQVAFVDPTTGVVKSTAALGQHMKDAKDNLLQGTVFGNDGSLYIVDRPVLDYNEYFGIQRLTLPSEGGRRDNLIKPFDMSGTNRPDINRETQDTTPPKVGLPPVNESEKDKTETPQTETPQPGQKPGDKATSSSTSSTVVDGSWARTIETKLVKAGVPMLLAKLVSSLGWIGQVITAPFALLLRLAK